MLAYLNKTLILGITGAGITLKALHSSSYPAIARSFSVMVNNIKNTKTLACKSS